jgi:hypothetical protein
MPGVAKNIPMTAQKTASWVTRGLVNTQYWRQRGIATGIKGLGLLIMI